MLRCQISRQAKSSAINNLFGTTEEDGDEVIFIPDGEVSDIEEEECEDEENPLDPNIASPPPPPEDVDGGENQLHSRLYRWRKVPLQVEEGSPCWRQWENPVEESSPYRLFQRFFSLDILKQIAFETNRYAVQVSGKSIDVTPSELEQLFGILLYMTLMDASCYRMYWANSTRWPPIADVMPVGRFEKIMKFLHLVNNEEAKKKGEIGYDPLFKVRPLFEHVRAVCQQIDPDEHQAIDEQMIPFKGRSHLRRYLPNKPTKWGFKVFARCSQSGIIHDFLLCTGKTECEIPRLGATGNIVRNLCLSLPSDSGCKVFFDNYYTTLELVIYLRDKMKLHSCGTIRANRLKQCPLRTTKELQKIGRGATDWYVDANSNIIVVRWLDNGPVTLVSTYAYHHQVGTVKRFSAREKQVVDIPIPKIVREYNTFMGGVDLMDMFLALYRIDRRSKRWYMRIIFYLLGLAVSNSWLLHKRHQQGQGVRSEDASLKIFIQSVAECLTKSGKHFEAVKRRRPPKEHSPIPEKKRRVLHSAAPQSDVRYDGFSHWPVHMEQKQRCFLCKAGFSRWQCEKCSLPLCLNAENNCFKNFHHVV